MKVHQPLGGARPLRHAADRAAGIAVLRDHVDRRLDQLLAAAGADRRVLAEGTALFSGSRHAFFRGGSKNMRLVTVQRAIRRSIFFSFGYQISVQISVPGFA